MGKRRVKEQKVAGRPKVPAMKKADREQFVGRGSIPDSSRLGAPRTTDGPAVRPYLSGVKPQPSHSVGKKVARRFELSLPQGRV